MRKIRSIRRSISVTPCHFVAAVGAKYIRVIEKDLADRFPDNAAVNAALRKVAEITARHLNDED
jgi:hypothetical protein